MATESGARESIRAIGCTHTVSVTDPTALEAAVSIARTVIADLERTASRFCPSELGAINQRSALGPIQTPVSETLCSVLAACLHAAHLTDGLTDPTVGAMMSDWGYDADLDLVRARPRVSPSDLGGVLGAEFGTPAQYADSPAPLSLNYQAVDLEQSQRTLLLPAGTNVDVGAVGKAWAADRIAALCADALPGGFAIECGGDVAVAGKLPPTGVGIAVVDEYEETVQTVVSHGQAFATSSTRLRRWEHRGVEVHHIMNPATGRPAPTTWAQVTVCAATSVEANAASTAAIVLGERAPEWLRDRGLSALLLRRNGPSVRVNWPVPTASGSSAGEVTAA